MFIKIWHFQSEKHIHDEYSTRINNLFFIFVEQEISPNESTQFSNIDVFDTFQDKLQLIFPVFKYC